MTLNCQQQKQKQGTPKEVAPVSRVAGEAVGGGAGDFGRGGGGEGTLRGEGEGSAVGAVEDHVEEFYK